MNDQCVRKGPVSDEFPEPITTGNNAGRCDQAAEFVVVQDDPDDPDRVCYHHLAQTVSAQSPRRPVTVYRLPLWRHLARASNSGV